MLKHNVQCNEKHKPNPICFAGYNVVEMSENCKTNLYILPYIERTVLDFELYNARFMAEILFYY